MENKKYTVLLYNSKSGSEHGFSKNEITETIEQYMPADQTLKVFDVIKNEFELFLDKSGVGNIDKVLISGGDGTISRNVKIVVENNLTLGIIPAGTFNNFAGDLNILPNLEDSIKIIFQGNITEIDTAKINDRYFLNNSSIGLYSASVKIRERTREEYKLNKITAMILAMARIFYRFPLIKLEINSGGKNFKVKTPFVFIGNNHYDFSLLNLGARNSIDEGKLHVNFSRCKTRLCLVKIGLKALFGKIKTEKDLTEHSVTELIIHSKKKKVSVAADGEIFSMKSPLKYKIVPKSLKVIVPQ